MKRRLMICGILIMILIVLLAILLSSVAAADNFFTMHWEPGEYKVTFTPEEDKLVDGILEEARKKSEVQSSVKL